MTEAIVSSPFENNTGSHPSFAEQFKHRRPIEGTDASCVEVSPDPENLRSKTTVIFVHGFGEGVDMFENQMRYVHDQGFRAVASDNTSVDVTKKLIEQQSGESAIVTRSRGSLSVAEAASKVAEENPDKTPPYIVFVDPAGIIHHNDTQLVMGAARDIFRTAADLVENHPPKRVVKMGQIARRVAQHVGRQIIHPIDLARDIHTIGAADIKPQCEELADKGTQFSVLVHADDRIISAEQMKQQIPAFMGGVTTLPGTHSTFFEEPEAHMKIITEKIKEMEHERGQQIQLQNPQ